MSSSESGSSAPHASIGSPGSSVSSTLQEEYDELLRHAVVVPNFDGRQQPEILTTAAVPPSGRSPSTTMMDGRLQRSPLLEDDDSQGSSLSASSDSNMAIPVSSQPERQTPAYVSPLRKMPSPSPMSTNNYSYTLAGTHPLVRPLGTVSDQLSLSAESEEVDEEDLQQVMPKQGSSMVPGSGLHEGGEEQVDGEDEDLLRLAGHLDSWCADLKRSVLAEFGQAKMRLIQMLRMEQNVERERHAAQLSRLHQEVDELRQLVATYEDSIQHKDHIISNLSASIQKMRDRMELQRSFAAWKVRHCDEKREAFTAQLARQHHEQQLKRKVYRAWHAILENKWRQRVERACQARAQEVCAQLAEKYEQRLAEASNTLQETQAHVASLQSERSHFEESMKRAFMRGVCALNMEAMGMFHEQPVTHDTAAGSTVNAPSRTLHQEEDSASAIPAAPGTQGRNLAAGIVHNQQPDQNERSTSSSTVVGAQPTVPSQRRQERQRVLPVHSRQKSAAQVTRTASRFLPPPVVPGNGQRVAVRVERHAPVQPQPVTRHDHVVNDAFATSHRTGHSHGEPKGRPVVTSLPIKVVE